MQLSNKPLCLRWSYHTLLRLVGICSLILWNLLLSLESSAQYSVPSTKNPVLDVFFVDQSHGWILTAEDKNVVLFRTKDSGSSWSRIETKPPIYKLFFLDSSNGWALAADEEGSQGVLTAVYKTVDGGQTWSGGTTIIPRKPGRTSMILDFWFLDESRGWFVGQSQAGSGLAFMTADGGESVRPAREIPQQEILNSVFGLGRDKLWIVGLNTLIATADAGRTWHSQLKLNQFHSNLGYVGLRGGAILDNGNGWAVGEALGVAILATRNSGKTWTTSFHSSEGNRLNSISFGDPAHGWAVGASTTLYCTNDAGRTWTAKPVLPKASDPAATKLGINVDNSFRKVVFVNAMRGWVISEGGFLFSTEDGGNSWKPPTLSN